MNPIVQFVKAISDAGGKFLLTIPLGGAALFSQYDAFRSNHPELPKLDPWWAYASLAVCAWIIIGFAIKETKRSLAQPRLYLANPQVEKVAVSWKVQKDEEIAVLTDYPFVASVFLHNAPETRQSQSRLDRAHVTLKFFDMDTGKHVKTLPFGRWADNTQFGHHDSPSSVDPIRYRDIEANDGPNKIDIALKYEAEADCFSFNSECWHLPGLKDQRWHLPGTRFYIHVIVKSSNAPDFVACFILENGGMNGSMTLRESKRMDH
jgi:hypothetical protein